MIFAPIGHITPKQDHAVLAALAEAAGEFCDPDDPISRIAIEVGSWVGSTALTIAPHMDRLYCIDTFQGTPGTRLEPIADEMNKEVEGVFRFFCRNMGSDLLLSKVFPCVGTSREWAFVFPTIKACFVFLDGDHAYEAVKEDIQMWAPKCSHILCGHDYSEHFPDVMRAVQECFPADVINVQGTVWWVDLTTHPFVL